MSAKIGRNQPCPCGGGKKYKHCHGSYAASPRKEEIAHFVQRQQAADRIRQNQQGLGRPVVSFKTAQNHQVVAVGDTVYWSTN
jgi:hypothetical protein